MYGLCLRRVTVACKSSITSSLPKKVPFNENHLCTFEKHFCLNMDKNHFNNFFYWLQFIFYTISDKNYFNQSNLAITNHPQIFFTKLAKNEQLY